MTDDQPEGTWVSAAEAVVKFSVTRPHLYVLASRQRWQSRVWNDGIKRYYIPNSYERRPRKLPNIHLTIPDNNTEDNADIQDLLYKQILDAREEVRQVEVQRLEEQIEILQEDKKYLRDKIDEVYAELPKILSQIGRLQSDSEASKKEVEVLKSYNKIATEELNNHENVIKSMYKKFILKKD